MSGRATLGPPALVAIVGAVALALAAAGCAERVDNPLHGVDVLAEGDGDNSWLGVRQGPELLCSRELGNGVETTGYSEYAEPPVLAEAAACVLPAGGAHEIVYVAGPAPVDAAEVVFTSDLGATTDAVIYPSKGQRWYVAEIADTEARLQIEALDVEGEVLDEAELDLRDAHDDVQG